MPTPVATARQCLTEESTRALNDAVSVAKRRNHAQTTSLHAISALITPSFTILRDALSRARSSAYSPRVQLRALELCIGVSLDRLPSSKNSPGKLGENEELAPPISNSLMAAIKRSQAHQRRQPDMYHLSQVHHSVVNGNTANSNAAAAAGPLSISCIKVELKHFVLSILDDPIVSRVLGDAGFRSSDIKMAIIHPPRWAPSSTTAARCPPLFLCNFTDFNAGSYGGEDENSKRIGEVMVKSKERNPVLVGVCAKDALAKFKENILTQKYSGLPNELHGVKLLNLDEGLGLNVEDVRPSVESENVVKFVVNLGDLKDLVNDDNGDNNNNNNNNGDDGVGVSVSVSVNDEVSVNDGGVSSDDCVKEVVIKVSKLVEVYGKKVRLIGEVGNYETYSKFVGRFPSIEKDWDLQLLPITAAASSSTSTSFEPKSSLMGSFVPFGGFFPTPSDFRAPITAMRQPFTRCNGCNESYERELQCTDQSSSLPSWLQRAESDPSKTESLVAQVKDVRNEKSLHLQKKWDDHCRLVHQNYPFYAPPVSLAGLQVAPPLGFQLMPNIQGSHSSSGDSSLNERASSETSPQKQNMIPESPKKAIEISECRSFPSLSLPMAHNPLPMVPVTTDLGLGMTCASKFEELKKPLLKDHARESNPFPGALPSIQGVHRKEGAQVERIDLGDYKPLFRKLTEAVSWQNEAICRITEIVSRCKTGRGNIWVNFLGPDRIGQKKIAQTLADAIHGSTDRLISLNLSCHDKTMDPGSLFLCQGMNEFDIHASRLTIVDHVARELCRKPQSVVFLGNVDQADPLLQNSLIRAIQTGKFPDSRGKEVGINNTVFVTTSKVKNDEKNLSPRKEFIKFLEEKILEAKNWEMQLGIRSVSGDACRSKETTVSLLSPKCPLAKRKHSEELDEIKRANKMTKKSLDLNLPLENTGELDIFEGDSISDGSKAWLEDFLAQVDGNVSFKPFDFDALADYLLRRIRLKLEEISRAGQRILLEIDHEVMLQILAAAWYSDKKGAVEEWVEDVLGSNLSEARERYHLSDESVIRLCSCEGVPIKDWYSGICLPRRINLSI